MKWLGRKHKWLLVLATAIALITSGALLLPTDSLIWWPATGGAIERYDLLFSTAELTARHVALFGSAAAGILGATLAIIAATRAGFGKASAPVTFVGALLVALHLLLPLTHLAITS
ncbi:MAG: hypothetical protein R6V07_12820 [Armatimonadota bacterium]